MTTTVSVSLKTQTSFYEENITALFTKKSAMLYELLLKINFQE